MPPISPDERDDENHLRSYQLEGGHATNALPQLAAANVNCRVLPEDSVEHVLAELKRVIADDQVAVTITKDEGNAPHFRCVPIL